jgi:hypothetical protein
MSWLLWKDYRQNRVAFYSALFFMAFPHLFAVFAVCCDVWLEQHREPGVLLSRRPDQWIGYFATATVCGFVFSQLSIAVVGGNAFAGERADRSAEFLVSLPISKGKIILSKLIVSLALALAIWLISSLILASLAAAHGELSFDTRGRANDFADMGRVIGCVAIVSATFFCVAWGLSSFLTSSTFSVLGGLFTPLLVVWGIMLVGYFLHVDFDRQDGGNLLRLLFNAVCLTISPLCFGLGTWYYLRRVEP